jgi:hypothetical protein
MPIEVEVSLKVPTFTVRVPNQEPRRVDNASVRFSKRVEVAAIPKHGETLQLTAKFGERFDAIVTQVNWSEEREVFVVACAYAKRSITPDEYERFTSDPDWVTRQVL